MFDKCLQDFALNRDQSQQKMQGIENKKALNMQSLTLVKTRRSDLKRGTKVDLYMG